MSHLVSYVPDQMSGKNGIVFDSWFWLLGNKKLHQNVCAEISYVKVYSTNMLTIKMSKLRRMVTDIIDIVYYYNLK